MKHARLLSLSLLILLSTSSMRAMEKGEILQAPQEVMSDSMQLRLTLQCLQAIAIQRNLELITLFSPEGSIEATPLREQSTRAESILSTTSAMIAAAGVDTSEETAQLINENGQYLAQAYSLVAKELRRTTREFFKNSNTTRRDKLLQLKTTRAPTNMEKGESSQAPREAKQ